MAGLYAPLPTLRSHPRGRLRTDRGRRGLLLLHRSGLSPHTPCRSPGALTYATACQVARPPLTDRTRSPRPQRAFTSRLSAVWSPSLPLGITTTWTGLLVLAGLAPAGMAASLAAPDPGVQLFRIRFFTREIRSRRRSHGGS